MFDLYQFLFTGIDIEVRTRFMADFVCSVYYDNFAKTVATINTNVSMFTLAEFIREFNDKILYGFVFAAERHTCMIREADRKFSDKQSRFVNNTILSREFLVRLQYKEGDSLTT